MHNVRSHPEVPLPHRTCGLSEVCEVPTCDDYGVCVCLSGKRVFDGIGYVPSSLLPSSITVSESVSAVMLAPPPITMVLLYP